MDALSRAIDHFKTQAALAEALGVEPMTVSQWKRRGVPPHACPAIERVTGGAVTCEQLLPDVKWSRVNGVITGYHVPITAPDPASAEASKPDAKKVPSPAPGMREAA